MKKITRLEQLVSAYVAFINAPHYSKEADKLARKLAKARREALKVCEPFEIDLALRHVGGV